MDAILNQLYPSEFNSDAMVMVAMVLITYMVYWTCVLHTQVETKLSVYPIGLYVKCFKSSFNITKTSKNEMIPIKLFKKMYRTRMD